MEQTVEKTQIQQWLTTTKETKSKRGRQETSQRKQHTSKKQKQRTEADALDMQHDNQQQCRTSSRRKRRKMDAQQHAGTEEEDQHADYADHIPDELERILEEFTGAEEERKEGADER